MAIAGLCYLITVREPPGTAVPRPSLPLHSVAFRRCGTIAVPVAARDGRERPTMARAGQRRFWQVVSSANGCFGSSCHRATATAKSSPASIMRRAMTPQVTHVLIESDCRNRRSRSLRRLFAWQPSPLWFRRNQFRFSSPAARATLEQRGRGGVSGRAWRSRRPRLPEVFPSLPPGGWRSAWCWPAHSGA